MPILHTVLNYSTTGRCSWIVVREFFGMQSDCVAQLGDCRVTVQLSWGSAE